MNPSILVLFILMTGCASNEYEINKEYEDEDLNTLINDLDSPSKKVIKRSKQ